MLLANLFVRVFTASRLGSNPIFYTAVGNDELGRGLLQRLARECGVTTTDESVKIVDDSCTAQYYALNDETSALVGAIADMDALAKIPIPSVADLNGVEFLVLDANLPADRIVEAARRGVQAGARVCFEPTSVPKSKALMQHGLLKYITYVFPNEDELYAMAEAVSNDAIVDRKGYVDDDDLGAIENAARALLTKMKSGAHIIVTLGSRGVLLIMDLHQGETPVFQHFQPEILTDVRSTNGPGDTLCGAFIHALLDGEDNASAVEFGMEAAVLSLRHESSAISPAISSLGQTKFR
jgi:sugar/nucleoside kinase (ribokinase family)